MSAIKVRGRVSIAQVQRVVAVVEQPQSALLVQCMRVRIRCCDLEPVAHAFFNVSGESVVSIHPRRLVVNRLRRIPNVRYAMVNVAAFIVVVVSRAVRQVCPLHVIAVRIMLAMDRAIRRSNARLVEGYRDYLVAAEVAYISELDGQIIAWLPLDIQRVVVGVRQFVRAVVDAERDRLAAVVNAGDIWQIFAQVRGLRVGWRGRLNICVWIGQVASRRGWRRDGRCGAATAAAGGNVIVI